MDVYGLLQYLGRLWTYIGVPIIRVLRTNGVNYDTWERKYVNL